MMQMKMYDNYLTILLWYTDIIDQSINQSVS
jgi:hypothetical protein